MTTFGVNLPYFSGAYAHDIAPNERLVDWPNTFHPGSGYRPLIEAKELGFSAVRIWLCEGGEGIVTHGERITSVRPELLSAVDAILECAERVGLYVYFGILDANSVRRDNDLVTRSILQSRDRAQEFAEHVLLPLTQRMNTATTFGIDLVNEPETATPDCADMVEAAHGKPIPWSTLADSLNILHSACRANFKGLVTFGSGHVFLPHLVRAVPSLQALDLHMYHDQGGLPSRADIARDTGLTAVLDRSFPLVAGECGTPKGFEASFVNYLHNAAALDYWGAFLWKLEGELIERRDAGETRFPGRKRNLTGDGRTVRDILHNRV